MPSLQPFRLAVAPVDEAGDEETKQLLEGDESLLGGTLIPKHSFTKDGWKVCGCFSIIVIIYWFVFSCGRFYFCIVGMSEDRLQ